MKRPLIGLFIGLLVSIAPIGPSTASDSSNPGYEWAEANDADELSDCAGHPDSFRESCEEYVLEHEED